MAPQPRERPCQSPVGQIRFCTDGPIPRLSRQTSMAHYRWRQFSVIRRFRDFALLHQRLCDKNPGMRSASPLVETPECRSPLRPRERA